MKIVLFFIKSYYSVISFFLPKCAAKKAFLLFQKVRVKTNRAREEVYFEKAKKFSILSNKKNVSCYEFGNPEGRIVFLVHGWDSNAGSLTKFAFELSQKSYRVIGFDLPAHGNTIGKYTNLYECKTAFIDLINAVSPKGRFDVISHSFGSAVVSYALSESQLKVGKMVFLTSPNRVDDIFIGFKNMINLGDKSYQMMVEKANEVLSEDLSQVNVEDKLKLVSFKGVLLIHDKMDKMLPYSNSIAIKNAVPKVELETYEKIGHYHMLWNDDVLKRAIKYIAE